MSERTPDLICLGEPMLELAQVQRGDESLYLPGFGGDTSNCAVAAARQGAHVGYITALGDDSFGRDFLDLWASEGIETGHVSIDPTASTGLYFITYRDGEHVFSYRRKGSAASRIHPHDLPREAVRQAKVLHVSGISQAISETACDTVFTAISEARKAAVEVSYDTNLRLNLWPLDRARAVIHAAMAESDIALPGLDDARTLTGLDDPHAIADFYLNLGPHLVLLTMGRQGTLVATPEQRAIIPVHPVEQVDATGAGDTFDGAFLARHIAGDDPFTAARYANVAAALSTLGQGAVAPIPRSAAVQAALKEAE